MTFAIYAVPLLLLGTPAAATGEPQAMQAPAPAEVPAETSHERTAPNVVFAEAGAFGGPDGGPTFESRPRTTDDVAATCADRTRYEEGAELAQP